MSNHLHNLIYSYTEKAKNEKEAKKLKHLAQQAFRQGVLASAEAVKNATKLEITKQKILERLGNLLLYMNY